VNGGILLYTASVPVRFAAGPLDPLGRIHSTHPPETARHPAAGSGSAISCCLFCLCVRAEWGKCRQESGCRFPNRYIFFPGNTTNALKAPANHDVTPPKSRSTPKHASARIMFHPLERSRRHSHRNERVICHCYAASRCSRLPYRCCRPLGASKCSICSIWPTTSINSVGPEEPEHTMVDVTRGSRVSVFDGLER
jgi:hypothetical protein